LSELIAFGKKPVLAGATCSKILLETADCTTYLNIDDVIVRYLL